MNIAFLMMRSFLFYAPTGFITLYLLPYLSGTGGWPHSPCPGHCKELHQVTGPGRTGGRGVVLPYWRFLSLTFLLCCQEAALGCLPCLTGTEPHGCSQPVEAVPRLLKGWVMHGEYFCTVPIFSFFLKTPSQSFKDAIGLVPQAQMTTFFKHWPYVCWHILLDALLVQRGLDRFHSIDCIVCYIRRFFGLAP